MSPTAAKVWVVSELYWPEETSTGHVLTGLAEGLAEHNDVGVLTARPTYSRKTLAAARRERRNGVTIERVWSTRLDKNKRLGRLGNLSTVSASLFLAALRRLRGGDRVCVVTNPPLLPYLVAVAARIRRAPYMLIVHDVFPDLPVAAGVARPGSMVVRLSRRFARWLYRGAAGIAVLGRDMRDVVVSTMNEPRQEDKVVVVPNWADLDLVRPTEKSHSQLLHSLGIADVFVVQFAGNIGPLQDVPTLLSAVELLPRDSIHFLVVGSGRMRPWLQEQIETRGLTNVTVLDPVERSKAQHIHAACDVAIVSLIPGMFGVSVPSRSYNFLAAGRPLIAALDDGSAIATLIREHHLGWVVKPGDATALAAAIEDASVSEDVLGAMGGRARKTAERCLTRTKSVDRLAELVNR